MSAVRHDRKAAITALIQEHDIRTQRELMDRLAQEGFEVTQATVSRDMADLRLEKDSSGVYVMPELLHLSAVIKTQVRETRRAGNQVIVICRPGSAEGVGAAIDAAHAEGVLGSIAGDDTLLVITQDDEAGASFQTRVDRLLD